MAKTEYIYYKDKYGFASNIPTVDKYNPHRTEEVIRDEIVNKYGCEIITEKEFHEIRFNNAMARMKTLFENEDIGKIFGWLSNNINTYSIKAFSQLSGVKLSRTWKKRKEQLIEYYGDKYVEWRKAKDEAIAANEKAKAEKEEQEWREELARIEKEYRAGKAINGREFLNLCDEYKIDTHIRTRGFVLKQVSSIQKDGRIWVNKKAKYAEGFRIALHSLNRAMGI
ncbi:MAG: hypothetical protein IKN12_00710 [Selenomonadaceae bacterium]|nr:hypothetical protein [Selenomonadaceae bacterium]